MKQYFLFGEDVVTTYYEEGIKRLKQAYEDNNVYFDLFEYNSELNKPIDLLNAAMGWNDYATITEEEFNFLNS